MPAPLNFFFLSLYHFVTPEGSPIRMDEDDVDVDVDVDSLNFLKRRALI
jgi:hypothetical protein